ncbi:2-C-methyl-D-erythritol 2,4-cyclodiphosphate synthase [Clostridium sp. 'deep sea']|nr:2-C-methyl-D-erythritol 2,4-cyclodiphosphate synthase [Clostridium sp. 'deep sea']
MVKTGFGIDIHQLKQGRKCILGGIEIPSDIGPYGHSDADVVIHALIDGLLGATALGDIGQWFPDTDDKYKDIDSAILLTEVVNTLGQKNYIINHIDINIVAEKPKIAPYVVAIRENLASLLRVNFNSVSVKATTAEKIGFIGRKEGIMATATVTIFEQTNNKKKLDYKVDYKKLTPMALAYMGDAVLELYVRRYLLSRGVKKGAQLQKLALEFVSAKAQAQMIKDNMHLLTEKEHDVWRWGRNSRGGNVPKNTDPVSYRFSTGLETLIGYIYFSEDMERLEELINILIENKKNKVEELK